MPKYKASQPAPIKHNFSSFAGERCPVCNLNRLVSTLQYPVCTQCRKKYDLIEDLLKKLQAHRLLISQEVIDWQQEPYPTIDGQIDDIPWLASFMGNEWLVIIKEPLEEYHTLAALITQYLNHITPAWLAQAENQSTKIRRYCFFIAAGATLATTTFLLKRRSDRLKKEITEAEEALRSGKVRKPR